MLQVSRILYPTDFSDCAGQALPHARHLAEIYAAELHILHALVLHEADPGNAAHRLPDMEQLYQALEQHAEARLEATKDAQASAAGFRVKSAQRRAISAASAVLDYAEEAEIDVIVMGTHGRRGLRRLLLGSVAEEVIRLAPCPVLTVPERAEGGPVDAPKRIVVPIDFSEHSKLALAYAGELSALYEAELLLLHVVDELVYPDFYPYALPSTPSMTEDLLEQSRQRLNHLLEGLSRQIAPATVHVRAGRAAPTINDFASEHQAGLIIIASHGLTGLSHMLLGSVTTQVVRGATCPVFTVKAFGKPGLSA